VQNDWYDFSIIITDSQLKTTVMSTSKFVISILGAAAAGVVIGMLVAPEKGTEMRKRIKKTTDGWVDSLNQVFSKAKDEAEEMEETLSKEMPQGA
jgi:gas vesicle protein